MARAKLTRSLSLGASEPVNKYRRQMHLHGVARAYEELDLVEVRVNCAGGLCPPGLALPAVQCGRGNCRMPDRRVPVLLLLLLTFSFTVI